MSDQFQPGDMVECVDFSPALSANSGRHVPMPFGVGELLIVTDAPFDSHRITGLYGQWLYFDDPGSAWASFRFRKVYRPKADLIERLTAEPAFSPPKRVKEDA